MAGTADRASSALGRALATNLLWKMATFALNVALTRHLSPSDKGIFFTFDLYWCLVGFLAREATRSAAARDRFDPASAASVADTANYAAATVGLGAALSLGAAGWAVGVQSGTEFAAALHALPFHSAAATAVLFVLGLVLDLATEPVVALERSPAGGCDLRSRVAVEGAASVASIAARLALLSLHGAARLPVPLVCTAGATVYGAVSLAQTRRVAWPALLRPPPPVAAGASQAALEAAAARGALASTLASLGRSGEGSFGLGITPRRVVAAFRRRVGLWASFFGESVLRLSLAEGEKILLGALAPLAAQGTYDVVASLGSLVVRLVFRLWEDACFVSVAAVVADGGRGGSSAPDDRQGTAAAEAAAGARRVCADSEAVLRRLLVWASYVGLAAAALGPPCAGLALRVLNGRAWATPEATAALQAYCYFVPLLGANGLLEAYVRAVAAPGDLATVKAFLTAASAAYLAACASVLGMGGGSVVGLILLNCGNMLARIVFALWLIARIQRRWTATPQIGTGRRPGTGGTGEAAPSQSFAAVALRLCLCVDRLVVLAFALVFVSARGAVAAYPGSALVEWAVAGGGCAALGAAIAVRDPLLRDAVLRRLPRRLRPKQD